MVRNPAINYIFPGLTFSNVIEWRSAVGCGFTQVLTPSGATPSIISSECNENVLLVANLCHLGECSSFEGAEIRYRGQGSMPNPGTRCDDSSLS
jgi:hypothetical protein